MADSIFTEPSNTSETDDIRRKTVNNNQNTASYSGTLRLSAFNISEGMPASDTSVSVSDSSGRLVYEGETDSDGRFKSVKFDNDNTVYSLNVEEVTNEAAYNDAMNAYLNKKAQYEKTIADINAKTSIIQKEDRTLELRLKQLDTEQHALATEMDAVKKVIKDNVEKTFKTFSD